MTEGGLDEESAAVICIVFLQNSDDFDDIQVSVLQDLLDPEMIEDIQGNSERRLPTTTPEGT